MSYDPKIKLWWEVQKNGGWKTLTNALSRSAVVYAQFDKFIKTFYWRFRRKKGIPQGSYHPEINFQGFKEFSTNEQGEMGHCSSHRIKNTINGKEIYNQTMSITLAQLYLLDKLGMDKFICSYSATEYEIGHKHREVSFKELIETIAHELAHAYQNTINNKKGINEITSQCESSGKKDANGKPLYPQLTDEHARLTTEIEQMITGSSEHQKFREWWVQKNSPQKGDEKLNDNLNDNHEFPLDEKEEERRCEVCDKPSRYNCCDKCVRKEKEVGNLSLSIQTSENLTDLENNYQKAKNDPAYSDNKTWLDSRYNATKTYLQESQGKHWWKDNKVLIGFSVIIGVIVIIIAWLMLFGQKKRKKRY